MSFKVSDLSKISETELSFSSRLLKWYNSNKRVLPWRQTQNPYFIWLSEVILQQTRVEQGMPYYLKFAEAFPTVQELAAATEDEVLRLWQGLGYYSRARNMHATARMIVDCYGGKFPSEYKDILALKGVGEYTAAAIVSFAYNKPYATVDGNVFRVLSRIFGVDEYIDTGKGKKLFTELATELIDKKSPGEYNQAIMDFGSLQCVPKSPNCGNCPFSDLCFAYNHKVIDSLPRKKGKIVTKDRFFNYLDISVGDKLFLRKREGNDIWKGLYEFPLIETDERKTFDQLIHESEYKKIESTLGEIRLVSTKEFKHVLSHQVIHAVFYKLEVAQFNDANYLKIDRGELGDYGVSRLIEKYLLDA